MRRALLCLAVAASPALGQEPAPPPTPTPVARIVAPASVPAGTPIVVYSTGSLSSKPLKFKLSSPAVPFDVYAKADNSETACIVRGEVTAAHPGPYQFVSIAAGGDDFDFAFATVPVVPQGPTPPPSPPPNPGPAPAPSPAPTPAPVVPASERLYATLVYDLKDPSVAAIKQAGLGATLEADNCKWEAFPESAIRVQADGTLSPRTIVEEQNLGPFLLAAGGTPCVVIQRKSDGAVVATLKAPTAAAVVARVKSLRGGAR